jgi:N-acyl-D-amino-acid deacylase
MPADLVIRGGTVVDGSGGPGVTADVAVADGVIREIGPGLTGDTELDASGCVVSPGFIDIHTHYDAQVFWDPRLRPSSYQGVTTVVAGNCGFTIAPTRPEHRDTIVHTLENVEDMDPATLTEGVVWDFETFPEYLAAVRRRGTLLNFTAYVGHSALRLYVLGDAAYERAATTDEIARMADLVREALRAGAAGFSTSFSYAHRGVDGKPVPSRFAEREEVDALFLAAGEAGRGMVLITPGQQCSYADVYEWQPRVGRPFTYPLFAAPGGRHLDTVRLHEEGLRAGADVWPQVTPRPLTMQFTLADPYSLNTGRVFGELLEGGRDERVAAYRDPAWRARAAADLEHSQMKPRWDTFEVSESERFPELVGRRVAELAAERGSSPLDVMCELSVAEDLTTRFRAYIANDDAAAVGPLLAHDHVALGLSDAGAHVDQLCDAPVHTELLGTWARDRHVLSLEAAVRKATGEAADMFGFDRRGYLRPGFHADVCVFDPETVSPGPLRRVRDFPADGERLTAEDPTGVRHVLVNGTPIRRDGEQLDPRPWPGAHPDLG